MFLDKIRSREKFSKSDIFKQNLADILFDKKNFYLKPDRIFCTFGKLIYLHALDADHLLHTNVCPMVQVGTILLFHAAAAE